MQGEPAGNPYASPRSGVDPVSQDPRPVAQRPPVVAVISGVVVSFFCAMVMMFMSSLAAR